MTIVERLEARITDGDQTKWMTDIYLMRLAQEHIKELEALLREIDNKVVYGAVIHDGTADDLQQRVEAALGFGKV